MKLITTELFRLLIIIKDKVYLIRFAIRKIIYNRIKDSYFQHNRIYNPIERKIYRHNQVTLPPKMI